MALLGTFLLTPTLGVLGQEATPGASPVAGGEVIQSLTREQMRAQIDESLEYSEAATQGGTFVDATVSDIRSLNPFLAEDEITLGIASLLFEGLTGGDPVTGQPAPIGLADRWEIAADRVTYTYFLNKDVKWHDGVDFTAEDVQFSYDALADPATGSAYTGAFLSAVASYRVVDADTFEVVAKEPLASFLYDTQGLYIVPKHIWESVPHDQWAADPASTGQDPSRIIGTGPFKFQEWQQGESVTLVRNDDYYGKVPYIDEYVLRIWPDQQQAVNALINGEIDAAGLEAQDVATVEGVEGVSVATYPSRSFTFYEFNLDPAITTLFQEVLVRQAMMYALDRESMVNDILLGYGEVAQGTQPLISYAYAPERNSLRYNYDPERARQLLAEAGWADSNGDGTIDKDGQELAFEFLHPSGSPTTDQLAAYMQDAWSQVGIGATPRALEFSALVEVLTVSHAFDLVILGFGWDASFIQSAMFDCDQYGVGFNDMRYCNPRIDELNAQARREFDPERRADLLIEVSNIVNEEQPVSVLYFRESIVAFSDRLRNYTPGPWGLEISYVWIQE